MMRSSVQVYENTNGRERLRDESLNTINYDKINGQSMSVSID